MVSLSDSISKNRKDKYSRRLASLLLLLLCIMRQGWQLFSTNSVKTCLLSKLLHNGEREYFHHDIFSCGPFSEVLWFFHVHAGASSCLRLFSNCDWNIILQESRRDSLPMEWKVKFVHFNCLEGLFPVLSHLSHCSNDLML